MKILFDINTTQVDAHLKWKVRLRTLEGILKEENYQVFYKEISKKTLNRCSLLVIPTRIKNKPFNEEIEHIYDFVKHGGNLLLMSNHHEFNINDSALAEKFGVRFEDTSFRTPGSCTYISGKLINKNHPIIKGESNEPDIKNLVTNTTCSIKSEIGTPIAYLSEKMQASVRSHSPKKKIYALSLDGKNAEIGDYNGRVIMTADSGFIGSRCSTKPGIGLIEEGDNRLFIKRAIKWLVS